MQRQHRADQCAEVDYHCRIVDAHSESFAQLDVLPELGKKPDDLLDLVDDLVVDGEF